MYTPYCITSCNPQFPILSIVTILLQTAAHHDIAALPGVREGIVLIHALHQKHRFLPAATRTAGQRFNPTALDHFSVRTRSLDSTGSSLRMRIFRQVLTAASPTDGMIVATPRSAERERRVVNLPGRNAAFPTGKQGSAQSDQPVSSDHWITGFLLNPVHESFDQ